MRAKHIKFNDSNVHGTFEETFPICTMGLILSCTYPQHNRTRKKLFHLMMVYLTMAPGISIIVCHMIVCALEGDYLNFSRQIIIELVIVIFIFKTSIIFAKGNKLRQMFDIISNDFIIMSSEEDEDFKNVFNKYIRLGKRSEMLLLIIAIILATLYPVVSLVSMIFTYLFTDDDYKTYDNMVNPLIVKGLEEKQFLSPYYEIIWLYCAYVCAIMSPCFAGIDGSFGIACAHISLKFEMMSLKLNKTCADSVTKEEVKFKLKSVIIDHVNAKKFYDTVREMYQDWLLCVYLLSSSIISLNLYQISIDDGVNLQFLIFFTCAIIHIYIPCYCASLVNEVGDKVINLIYMCGWEDWSDPIITKTVMYMIAYSQRTLEMKARGLVTFNMDLFVSTLKASYSFYTLIRS